MNYDWIIKIVSDNWPMSPLLNPIMTLYIFHNRHSAMGSLSVY